MKVICLKWLCIGWFWFIKMSKKSVDIFNISMYFCSFTLELTWTWERELPDFKVRPGSNYVQCNHVGSRFIAALSIIVIPEWIWADSALIIRRFIIIAGEKCVLTRDEECELWSGGWMIEGISMTAARKLLALQSAARFIVLSLCWSVRVDRICILWSFPIRSNC